MIFYIKKKKKNGGGFGKLERNEESQKQRRRVRSCVRMYVQDFLDGKWERERETCRGQYELD